MCLIETIRRANGDEELFIIPRAAYVLPDGGRASAVLTLVWCDDCRRFAAGECLLDIRQIDQMLIDFTIPPYAEWCRFIVNDNEDFRRETVADLRRQRHWFSLRTSPAKCLQCGSAKVRPAAEGEFSHPLTGERCVREGPSFGSTSADNEVLLLDVEGRRLGETSASFRD